MLGRTSVFPCAHTKKFVHSGPVRGLVLSYVSCCVTCSRTAGVLWVTSRACVDVTGRRHDHGKGFRCDLCESIFSACVSWSVASCQASLQQTSEDLKNEVVVLSDQSQILFKESRHPQNMPLICYYFSDANFFASLSWVTSTKEIQVKLAHLPSPS